MGLGGDSLIHGNPQPVIGLLFCILQEVECVRRREPAAINKHKKMQLTGIQHKTQTGANNRLLKDT